MSDYISKSALKKYLRDYKWEFALRSDFSKAIEMVDVQPTVDKKEIICKSLERILERLEEQTAECIECKSFTKETEYYDGAVEGLRRSIKIVKEEGGV